MIVVAGIGNELFGDDGFGPTVARRLADVDLGPDVRVVEVGLRGVHLAYDVADDVDTLVVIDLVEIDEPPGTVVVLDADVDVITKRSLDGHGIDLVGVIDLARRIGQGPDKVLVVGCRPVGLEPGAALTTEVAAAVERTASVVVDLLSRLRRDSSCSDA